MGQQNISPQEFTELLLTRHSIRRYTDEKIDPDKVKDILQAALLAPTSKSARPWQFVVVEDPETLQALAGCKPLGAHSLKTCVLAVVVCADPAVSPMILEDCAIAAEFMQLQAAVLGIGSCWVQVRGRDNAEGIPSDDVVRQLLDIPADITVECIMTFGYSAETRRPVDPSKLKWEKVHIGKWTDSAE
ncbi:MAG: nitroreductase family protein [Bacteroidales bacterium]|nr:nitroreductase family protein [Bacteroidales bacterium]